MGKLQGNASNVRALIEGQVLVSFDKNPKINLKTGEFDDSWFTVGILSEDGRIEINRTIDKNKVNGWGYGTVAVTAKPGELTATCDVLEDNDIVDRIKWEHKKSQQVDGAKAEILYHDAEIARPFVAFVEKFEDGKVRITASRYKSYATIENLGFGSEIEATQISFDFITGPNKDAFDRSIVGEANTVSDDSKIIRFDANADQPDAEGETIVNTGNTGNTENTVNTGSETVNTPAGNTENGASA